MHVADLTGVAASVARRDAPASDPSLTVPLFSYLVDDGAGGLTVFDLGCGAQDAGVQGRPRIENHRPVGDAVRELGRAAEDVGTIVISHLHWDHCVGMAEFPRATVLAQRAELGFAEAPPATQQQQYDAPATQRRAAWLDDRHRIEAVVGDRRLGDHVRIVPTPGHTAGSQSLLVQTFERDLLLCGDLFMSYDQWFTSPSQRWAPGLISDIDDWHASMAMVEREGWTPLPAHDPRVPQVLSGEWVPGGV